MSIRIIHKNISRPFLVVCALLFVLGGWEIGKYQIVPRRFGVVEQGQIYRSGRIAPHLMRPTLQKYGIKVIVDLTEPDARNASQCAEKKAAEELGISRYNFQLSGDGTGNITNYAKAIAVLAQSRKEKKPVLVHCAAGTQRTGGVIAAYRLLVEKQPPATASAELSRYGWKARHDRVLLDYLNPRLKELAALLQEMKVITAASRLVPQIAP